MSAVVLGRVIMGDVAVTLVDLVQRGLVEVTEVDGMWLLAAGSSRSDSVVSFEKALLDGLSAFNQPVSLTVLAAEFSLVLNKVRDELISEAVHRGWSRRWPHDRKTREGEDLTRRLRAFRGELRRLKSDQGEDVLVADWLPYGLRFGLVSCDQIRLARFARAWVDAFAGLDGWSHAEHRQLGVSLDLAAAWELGLQGFV